MIALPAGKHISPAGLPSWAIASVALSPKKSTLSRLFHDTRLPMTNNSLHLFTRQLACWTEELLQRSRSPLRKVELAPEISTPHGNLHPNIVAWVNRDSCMAGGIILVPTLDAKGIETEGRQCAQSLGLRHFVIWGAREIIFWEVGDGELFRHKTLPAPPAGSEATVFHKTLTVVLEELKYLTVAGIMSPDELPCHYFVNLCRGALEDTLPGLTEMVRIARSEESSGEGGFSPERQALDKAVFTLARLTALLHFDQLPAKVQPEGLERAMFYALDTLPAGLRRSLEPAPGEPTLPPEAAVRFHHLLRRLAQLGGCQDGRRLARILELLLARYQQELGLQPCESTIPTLPGPRLLVNIGGLPFGAEDQEVALPSALAFFALLRHLWGQPEALLQVPDPFDLSAANPPRMVVAALGNSLPVPARERAALQAKLRISWPTRRFRLPSTLPRWGWELLHLTGLAADTARMKLRTPGGWLAAPFAPAFLEVLQKECSISEILRMASGALELDLIKGEGGDGSLRVIRAGGGAPRDGAMLRNAPAILWALAMELPDSLWALFESRLLHPVAPDDWPQDLAGGVALFIRSSLGRALWQVVGQGQSLPGGNQLPSVLATRRFPLPGRDVLLHLQRLADEYPQEIPSKARLDAELTPWFSSTGAIPLVVPAVGVSSETKTGALPLSELQEVLQREVLQDGIPSFPEHYLFAHFRPCLANYRFTPPLLRTEQFFGQVTFKDGAGSSFQAPSPEVAQALELIAASGRQAVCLPTDPAILNDILDRYLHDLGRLHGTLQRRVHALVADPRQARSMVRKFWSDLGLPAPELFISRGK